MLGGAGAYSWRFKQLQQQHMEDLKTNHGMGMDQHPFVHTKRLHNETSRRRKEMADKRKFDSDKEERRRQEILAKRREEIRLATERYQRRNSHYVPKTEKEIKDMLDQRFHNPQPTLDDALRAIHGRQSPTQGSRPNSAARLRRSQSLDNNVNTLRHKNPNGNLYVSPYHDEYGEHSEINYQQTATSKAPQTTPVRAEHNNNDYNESLGMRKALLNNRILLQRNLQAQASGSAATTPTVNGDGEKHPSTMAEPVLVPVSATVKTVGRQPDNENTSVPSAPVHTKQLTNTSSVPPIRGNISSPSNIAVVQPSVVRKNHTDDEVKFSDSQKPYSQLIYSKADQENKGSEELIDSLDEEDTESADVSEARKFVKNEAHLYGGFTQPADTAAVVYMQNDAYRRAWVTPSSAEVKQFSTQFTAPQPNQYNTYNDKPRPLPVHYTQGSSFPVSSASQGIGTNTGQVGSFPSYVSTAQTGQTTNNIAAFTVNNSSAHSTVLFASDTTQNHTNSYGPTVNQTVSLKPPSSQFSSVLTGVNPHEKSNVSTRQQPQEHLNGAQSASQSTAHPQYGKVLEVLDPIKQLENLDPVAAVSNANAVAVVYGGYGFSQTARTPSAIHAATAAGPTQTGGQQAAVTNGSQYVSSYNSNYSHTVPLVVPKPPDSQPNRTNPSLIPRPKNPRNYTMTIDDLDDPKQLRPPSPVFDNEQVDPAPSGTVDVVHMMPPAPAIKSILKKKPSSAHHVRQYPKGVEEFKEASARSMHRSMSANGIVNLKDSMEVNKSHLQKFKADVEQKIKKNVRFSEFNSHHEFEDVDIQQDAFSEGSKLQHSEQGHPHVVTKPTATTNSLALLPRPPRDPPSGRAIMNNSNIVRQQLAQTKAQQSPLNQFLVSQQPQFNGSQPANQFQVSRQPQTNGFQPRNQFPGSQQPQYDGSNHRFQGTQQTQPNGSQPRNQFMGPQPNMDKVSYLRANGTGDSSDAECIALDRTPTDDEINHLWAKVQDYLHRPPSNQPKNQPPTSAVSQKYMDGAALATSELRVLSATPYSTFRGQPVQRATSARPQLPVRKLNMDALNSHTRRMSLLGQRKAQNQAAIINGGMYQPMNMHTSIQPLSQRYQERNMQPRVSGYRYQADGVNDSLASFMEAEKMAEQPSTTVSQIEASLRQANGRQEHTALSMEEQRLLQSLERLDERLKVVTYTGAPSILIPKPPPNNYQGFRGHQVHQTMWTAQKRSMTSNGTVPRHQFRNHLRSTSAGPVRHPPIYNPYQ